MRAYCLRGEAQHSGRRIRPLAPFSCNLYESLWANHIEPKLGMVALRDLSAEAIRAVRE
jgi:hypothetical protein